jgi:two-component system OmpR family sensor kinase
MRGVLGSFTGKLILLLAILIAALGLFYLTLTLIITKSNLEVVDQSLNRDVATHILETRLKSGNVITGFEMNTEVIAALMEINPNAEIYLLDKLGTIVSHGAPAEKVKLQTVAVEPIKAFLARSASLPIYGDDPRAPKNRKVFSAAAISQSADTVGYVYVVLGGEAYASAANMFRESYVLRLSSGLVAGSVVLAVLIGALSFYRMTKPLRHLTQTVSCFGQQNLIPDGFSLASRIRSDDEVGRLAQSFDQMANRICDQIQMLKRADEARREFMVYISHDLKTPIASVQSYLETLQMKWAQMEEAQRDGYLASALKANDRICMLVDGIFELAKLEGPEAPLQFESFSITELIQDLCQKLRFKADEAEVALAVDWQDRNVYVTGDIGLIERALANIIENAIKFSGAGQAVNIKVSTGAEFVWITVANQGSVIAEDDLNKIFRPFYRGRNAGQNARGSGLGLPIAKRVAELHDGFVQVLSAEATGTVFTIGLREKHRFPGRPRDCVSTKIRPSPPESFPTA